MTICPYCEKVVSRLNIQALKGGIGNMGLNCISLNCPSCKKSLGVQVDPIAIKSDTVNAISRSLS